MAKGQTCSVWMIVLTAASCGTAEPALSRFRYTEPYMGMAFTITLYAADEASASRGTKNAFERINALDDIMSDYRPTSELMQLCQKAGGDPVRVSEDLFEVLACARKRRAAPRGRLT